MKFRRRTQQVGINCEGYAFSPFLLYRRYPNTHTSLSHEPIIPNMCNYQQLGITFGCSHFIPLETASLEYLSSCSDPYCRMSAFHPTDYHACHLTCNRIQQIVYRHTISRSAQPCPNCWDTLEDTEGTHDSNKEHP